MRAVVQRVSSAAVDVEESTVAAIGAGLLVYLGIEVSDNSKDVGYTALKIAHLRVFDDDAGTMNRSVLEVGGSVLLVSQFTLYGDTRKGRRPSYNRAAAPESAYQLYCDVADHLRSTGLHVETGRYRTEMAVRSVVAGPVTILIDSHKEF